MKVKIFYVNDPMRKRGSKAAAFEADLNTWLAENPGIEIVRIEQSAAGGSYAPINWLISVWYKM